MSLLNPTAIDQVIGRTPTDEYRIESSSPHALVLRRKTAPIQISIGISRPDKQFIKDAVNAAVGGGQSKRVGASVALVALNDYLVKPNTSISTYIELDAISGWPLSKALWPARCPLEPVHPSADISVLCLVINFASARGEVALDLRDVKAHVEGNYQFNEVEVQACNDAVGWLLMDMIQGSGLLIREWLNMANVPSRLLWGTRWLSDVLEDAGPSIESVSRDRRSELTYSLSRFADRTANISRLYHGVFARELVEESMRLSAISKRIAS